MVNETAGRRLSHLRWDWTLNPGNPDRTDYRSFAAATGRPVLEVMVSALAWPVLRDNPALSATEVETGLSAAVMNRLNLQTSLDASLPFEQAVVGWLGTLEGYVVEAMDKHSYHPSNYKSAKRRKQEWVEFVAREKQRLVNAWEDWMLSVGFPDHPDQPLLDWLNGLTDVCVEALLAVSDATRQDLEADEARMGRSGKWRDILRGTLGDSGRAKVIQEFEKHISVGADPHLFSPFTIARQTIEASERWRIEPKAKDRG